MNYLQMALLVPPYPFEYQGKATVTLFLEDRARLRGAPLHLVPTRANGQPAFGCYLDDRHAPVARPFGFIVLTFQDEQISAITFFSDTSVFARFGYRARSPAPSISALRLAAAGPRALRV
jgi:hypothetical protein